MLSVEQIRSAAVQLDQAEQAREQIKPTSVAFPGMDIADAYAVQDAWVQMKLARGRRILGRKIGLTSRAMQQAMQIDEPDYGTLLDDMFFTNGSVIAADQFCDPKIEVELAFVLAKPLQGADVDLADVLQATDYVVPALELIAARSHRIDPATGKPRGVVDTISDNAANAGVIVGERDFAPDEIDMRWVSALLIKNDVVEETGVAAGVLNHPANGVAWLCRKFAEHGIGLEAGQLILAGSFTRPVAVVSGDTIEADYGPLGSVSCRFS